jgi:pimeloyl-ACP methyl ester carboxylesterase
VHVTTADGVPLWFEVEGEGPPVVLLPGRGDASDVYPGRFSDALVAAGCQVVRFDPRDTGLSGDGGPDYTMQTMADDVLCVLDAVGTERAHLVALSMSGLHLVDLATQAPGRVASATFLAAMSPDPDAGFGEDFFAALGNDPDPVELLLGHMGSPTAEDRAWVEAELAAAAERAPARPEAAHRHMDAAMRFGWPELDRLGQVEASALVIQGDRDRVLPLAHAEALARGIAGAHLEVLAGMGHIPRPSEWDEVARLVAAHVLAADG